MLKASFKNQQGVELTVSFDLNPVKTTFFKISKFLKLKFKALKIALKLVFTSSNSIEIEEKEEKLTVSLKKSNKQISLFEAQKLFQKPKEKLIKGTVGLVILFLILNITITTFGGGFFVFSKTAFAQEEKSKMCSFASDVFFLVDVTQSMDEGERESKCEWGERRWYEEGEYITWYLNRKYNVSEDWCLNVHDSYGETSIYFSPKDPEYTPALPSKLQATKQAISGFLDNLGEEDQSGIISFADNSVMEKNLSNNHSQTQNIVNSLTTRRASSTNLAEAIQRVVEEFSLEGVNSLALKVAILLTDGQESNQELLSQAISSARAIGARIFVIGLGERINQSQLQNIANQTNANAYFTNDHSQLESIYQNVADDICRIAEECQLTQTPGDCQDDGKREVYYSWNYPFCGEDYTEIVDDGSCACQYSDWTNDQCVGRQMRQIRENLTEFAYCDDLEQFVDDPICAEEEGEEGGGDIFSINPGDIIITEIMVNPGAVADADGEWFEIYNITNHPLDLSECIIRDNNRDSHTIDGLIVDSFSFAVLARNGDSGTNGGINANYIYSSFVLANREDEIILECGGVEIDRVEYNRKGFPIEEGMSMILTDFKADNNDDANWCLASSVYGAGDYGTPGEENGECYTSEEEEEPVFGSISGYKYSDLNYNSQIDEGESTLSGWNIILEREINGNWVELAQTTTDDNGYYIFENLEAGNYRVREVLPEDSDWIQTYPENSYWKISLKEGDSVGGINFANYLPVCGNGILDEGEKCDDGNLMDGDGCSSMCQTEQEGGPGGNQEQQQQEQQEAQGEEEQQAEEQETQEGGGVVSGGGGAVFTPQTTFEPKIISGSVKFSLETEVERGIRMVIEWKTNYYATSQVIYSEEGQPHTLDPNSPPTYGYTYTTPVYDTNLKVLEHRVVVENLKPNTKYYFRAVSTASPPTFSEEFVVETGQAPIPKDEIVQTIKVATLILSALEEKIKQEIQQPAQLVEEEKTEEVIGEETEKKTEKIPISEQEPQKEEISLSEKEVTVPVFEERILKKGFLAAMGEFFRPSILVLLGALLIVLISLGFRFYKKRKNNKMR